MSSSARIAVIVNSRAGTAAGHPRIAAEVTELFRAAGSDVDVIELREGEDLTAVAREASARAAIVTAAGGDGTVNRVASGLVHSQAALGVLPLGTLNHFARDLRIPFDLPKAVAVVAARRIGFVDVGEVNGAVFLNNSSIGLYPSIVEEREALRRRGHRKWPAMAIATAHVTARYRGVTVTIEVDGVRRTWRTPFVFIGNNAYQIDGVHLGERARLDEGTLFVYLAPRLRAHQLPMLLVKALVGHARRSGDFEIVPAAELWVGTAKVRRQRVALDGEIESMNTPLHYRTRPKALRVVVPAG